MKFTTLSGMEGPFIVDLEPVHDDRGHFARSFSAREFEEHGLNGVVAQTNVAFNRLAGTIRGFHFQYPPSAETKIVRCVSGSILDVIIDLRPESSTFLQTAHIELFDTRMLYIPARFAHGYQTLEPETEVHYLLGEYYTPDLEGGVMWNDPLLRPVIPFSPPSVLSSKDRQWPSLEFQMAMLRQRMAL